MKLSIAIVTWNARDYLKKCIQSIYRETRNIDFEIFVIDNASEDGTSEMVKNEFEEVRLIVNKTNLGYARANNIAIKKILEEKKSNLILLLNSDTVIKENAIERMCTHMEEFPAVGAAAPALVLPNGRFQTGPAGFLPNARTGFNYFFFLFKLFPGKFKSIFLDPAYYAKRKQYVVVEWLSGACLMLKRETIEKIGFLDKDYFFYAEDIEWARKMKLSNIPLHFLPQIQIDHFHGVTFHFLKKVNTHWLGMLFQYVKKERGGFEYFLFRTFSILGFFLRFSLYAALSVLKRQQYFRKKRRELFGFFIFSLTGRINHAINSTIG